MDQRPVQIDAQWQGRLAAGIGVNAARRVVVGESMRNRRAAAHL